MATRIDRIFTGLFPSIGIQYMGLSGIMLIKVILASLMNKNSFRIVTRLVNYFISFVPLQAPNAFVPNR